jgi:hypothetical protein
MYVDGWNFYYSLEDADIKGYGWCNFPLLARQQTSETNAEVSVKYFTSADRPNPEKISNRQVPIWWEALRLIGCDIIEGNFGSPVKRSKPTSGLAAGSGVKKRRTSLWLLIC